MASHNMTVTIDPDNGNPVHGQSVEFAGGDLPALFFIFAVAATFCTKYFFTYRARRDAQASIQAALERGQALTPEILDRLVHPEDRPARRNSDLRRGILGITLGVGIGAIGLIVGDPDSIRIALGIGVVPVLVGLAYVALWRFEGA
jgi:hypothetical protein